MRTSGLMKSLSRVKSVEQSIQDTDEPGETLKKELTAWDLTFFGVGVIIGTGIFALTCTFSYATLGAADARGSEAL